MALGGGKAKKGLMENRKAKRQLLGGESKKAVAGGEKAKGQQLGERKQKDSCWERGSKRTAAGK